MEFLSYFYKSENIVALVEFVFFAILSIILLVKTGNTKELRQFFDYYKKHFFGGAVDMKYRDENYQETEPVSGQTFETKLKLYKYDKVNDCLVEDGEVDIQEMINSSLNTCMTEVLSKFFPDRIPVDNRVVELETVRDDLDFLQETFSVAEDYKRKFGLPVDMSVTDVYKFIAEKEKELRSALGGKKEIKQSEVKKDEKETLEENK